MTRYQTPSTTSGAGRRLAAVLGRNVAGRGCTSEGMAPHSAHLVQLFDHIVERANRALSGGEDTGGAHVGSGAEAQSIGLLDRA